MSEQQQYRIVKTDDMRYPLKVWASNVEDSAIEQAKDIARHPACAGPVCLMPDAHFGVGMPIGGVAVLDHAVCPNMVGVDIGCGMAAFRTDLKREELTKDVLMQILALAQKLVPMGFAHNKSMSIDTSAFVGRYNDVFNEKATAVFSQGIITEAEVLDQLGTLGGGNHFVEIQADEQDRVWLMIHSGSRNLGQRICNYFHKVALEKNQAYHVKLPNDKLAFLPISEKEGYQYIQSMNLCLRFASANRKEMARRMFNLVIADVLKHSVNIEETVIMHHNFAEPYLNTGWFVHRKGATPAVSSQLGIIPGSMGTSSYIVRGRNNTESYMSCSHGAGRKMSRTEARNTITMEAFKARMGDIPFQVNNALLDESPDAYKDIDQVMADQSDLVDIVHRLVPLLPIKDASPDIGHKKGRKSNHSTEKE